MSDKGKAAAKPAIAASASPIPAAEATAADSAATTGAASGGVASSGAASSGAAGKKKRAPREDTTAGLLNRYKSLKKKFKYLVYAQEGLREDLRRAKKRIARYAREKDFLLDRLEKHEGEVELSDNVDDYSSSDDDDLLTVPDAAKGANSKKRKRKAPAKPLAKERETKMARVDGDKAASKAKGEPKKAASVKPAPDKGSGADISRVALPSKTATTEPPAAGDAGGAAADEAGGGEGGGNGDGGGEEEGQPSKAKSRSATLDSPPAAAAAAAVAASSSSAADGEAKPEIPASEADAEAMDES